MRLQQRQWVFISLHLHISDFAGDKDMTFDFSDA